MNLIFIGFKGVGKSTLGKKLANLLRYEFVDTDILIEDLFVNLGNDFQEVHKIHEILGEEGFRKLESEALNTLKNREKQIISVGGGTVLSSENVQKLKALGKIVYLSKDKEQILDFFKATRIPSFLDPGNLEESFDAMYNERLSIYESLAQHTVNTSKHNEAEVLAKLYEIAFKS